MSPGMTHRLDNNTPNIHHDVYTNIYDNDICRHMIFHLISSREQLKNKNNTLVTD